MWLVYDKNYNYVYARFFKRPEALQYSKLLRGMYKVELGVKKDDDENLRKIVEKVKEGWILYHAERGFVTNNMCPERMVPNEGSPIDDVVTKDEMYFWAKSDDEAKQRMDQWAALEDSGWDSWRRDI